MDPDKCAGPAISNGSQPVKGESALSVPAIAVESESKRCPACSSSALRIIRPGKSIVYG